MKDFKDKIAVITGAGTGMGRGLAQQLAAEGCHVAICDFVIENLNETKELCEAGAAEGTRVTAHDCDVANRDQVIAFRDAVKAEHGADHINLLFNNAGIGGAQSFLLDSEEDWDMTMNVDWFGVYYCARAFMPMLLASTEGCIINTSSVNGFWACLGNEVPHCAYSTAKFAVKGFTEGLIVDFSLNAPHLKAFLVMPGHIGTSIGRNSNLYLGKPQIEDMSDEQLEEARQRMKHRGLPEGDLDAGELREAFKQRQHDWQHLAPLNPSQAAAIILDHVRKDEWRILVGEDAKNLDRVARNFPEELYYRPLDELSAELPA